MSPKLSDYFIKIDFGFYSIYFLEHWNTPIFIVYPVFNIKDTLWVLRRDEPLVHVSVDISLITKHILDHDISLKS